MLSCITCYDEFAHAGARVSSFEKFSSLGSACQLLLHPIQRLGTERDAYPLTILDAVAALVEKAHASALRANVVLDIRNAV